MTIMTGINPAPAPAPAHVEADPKRPYKAIAGAIVTFLGLIWASLEGRDNLDNMTAMEWAAVIVPAILTFGTIYGVRNPKVLDTGGAARDHGELGAADPALMLIVAGLILAVIGLVVAEVAFLLWVGVVCIVVGLVLVVLARART